MYAVALLVTSVLLSEKPSFRVEISSQTRDSYVTTSFSEKDFEDIPRWATDKEHPPVSAKKAIRAAEMVRAKIVADKDGWEWKLDMVALHPAPDGHWYYVVSYEATSKDIAIVGLPPRLSLVVLMDGNVVKPAVRKLADKKR